MKHEGYLEVDGFKLKYISEGEGPDTLIIGSSIYYHRSFSEQLRKSLRLHFVDYRGFAEGPKTELSFDTLLNDIELIRQKLGLNKCIVVGHSAHALLALEYAKKYQEHVSHVVLVGSPPHMKTENVAMAQRNWDESVWPERKAAFERNMVLMPDAKLNQLPRDQWFLHMNFRNAPKSWYDYNFDSRPIWEGVKPNTHVLDQMYLRFVREVDVSKGLEELSIPVLIVYGRFEYLVAPVHSWDPLRPKLKDLTVRVFEKSAHSPHYEQPNLFDAMLLEWLKKGDTSTLFQKF